MFARRSPQTGKGVLGWSDCKDAVRTLGTPFSEAQFNAVKVGCPRDAVAAQRGGGGRGIFEL